MGVESKEITLLSRLRGHLAIFVAAILWGAMSPVAKDVMEAGAVSPMALSAIRILGGTIVFWVASLLMPPAIKGEGRPHGWDFVLIALMSVTIVSVNQGLYIIGIGYTTPFEATVMTTMTPVFTMLLAAIFIAMPMTVMKVTGVVTGLAGALLLAFASRSGDEAIAKAPMLGNLMCMGAQISAAVYYTAFRGVIARYHPFVLLKWLFLAGSITWMPFAVPSLGEIQFNLLDMRQFVEILYIIIFPTFFSYLFMVYAQQRLKPTSVAMYNYVQPLTAAVIASVMGYASFGFANIIASVLIFGGVALVAFSPGAAIAHGAAEPEKPAEIKSLDEL